MMLSRFVDVQIDLAKVRAAAQEIALRTGVDVYAVVKADAYGLGAVQVTRALREAVAGYCVFSLDEARSLGRAEEDHGELLIIGPPTLTANAEDYLLARARPAVANVQDARQLSRARPILCVDTGMQRFACPPDQVEAVISAGGIDHAFTHATRMDQVDQFRQLVRGKVARFHAAGSSLLEEPDAWLHAVRPGIALYRGSVRVVTRLVEVRKSNGPIGYTGWVSHTGYHGVIMAGYSHGLRKGPILIHGHRHEITEVGMQTAYVTVDPHTRPGDEVTLLGDDLTEAEIAKEWATSSHEVLLRMTGLGIRRWKNP